MSATDELPRPTSGGKKCPPPCRQEPPKKRQRKSQAKEGGSLLCITCGKGYKRMSTLKNSRCGESLYKCRESVAVPIVPAYPCLNCGEAKENENAQLCSRYCYPKTVEEVACTQEDGIEELESSLFCTTQVETPGFTLLHQGCIQRVSITAIQQIATARLLDMVEELASGRPTFYNVNPNGIHVICPSCNELVNIRHHLPLTPIKIGSSRDYISAMAR